MCENDLLNEIKKYQFYAVELNLYLDNFPNNSKSTNKEYAKNFKKSIVGILEKQGNFDDAYVTDYYGNKVYRRTTKYCRQVAGNTDAPYRTGTYRATHQTGGRIECQAYCHG